MVWLSVFIAFVTLLATCRITRLIVEDSITEPVRNRIRMKAQPRHVRPAARPPGRPAGDAAPVMAPAPRAWRYLNKLTTCTWCSGFWVSVAVTLAYYRCWLGVWPFITAPLGFTFVAAVFALSWLSAVLADWLDAPPPPHQLQHVGSVHVQLTPPPN